EGVDARAGRLRVVVDGQLFQGEVLGAVRAGLAVIHVDPTRPRVEPAVLAVVELTKIVALSVFQVSDDLGEVSGLRGSGGQDSSQEAREHLASGDVDAAIVDVQPRGLIFGPRTG